MAGRIVHFELPYDDRERAAAFYGQAFGWQADAVPGLDYTAVTTGPSDQTGPTEAGFINGGMFQRQGPFTGPNVVIDVEDIDDALAAVEAAGGTTVEGRTPVGDMGFAAYFEDTEGNLIGLWQTAQQRKASPTI